MKVNCEIKYIIGHWTNKLIPITEAIEVSSFYPGNKKKYLDCVDHHEAKKQSYEWFKESEANCNTCKHLQRVQHEKRIDGLLIGKCLSKPINQSYANANDIKFYPNDCMLMTCYESR